MVGIIHTSNLLFKEKDQINQNNKISWSYADGTVDMNMRITIIEQKKEEIKMKSLTPLWFLHNKFDIVLSISDTWHVQ